mgnify:CR=1 FL=1
MLSSRQRWVFRALVLLWLAGVSAYLFWWFDPSHIITPGRYIFNTLLLLWSVILPGYYFYFVSRMLKSNPELVIPSSWRVAMVVTRAPSEPFSIVRPTLEAMLSQDHPHDTWLADENPTSEILAWCQSHGVFVCTRYRHPDYQRDTWPRRKKCKEGNLAFFYNYYGYSHYDFVAQLDADHIPEPGYLQAMLRPFMDDRVGYVSAPSICDTNASSSWAARARLYAEATLHGSLQSGYTNDWAPLCIGSHYAVRTSALFQIGGLGPELAEDHSTSLLFNAFGWRGVHAIDAIAHGEGPATFADAMIQEFQWARSLVMLLLTVTPKIFHLLSPKKKLEFLFAQSWYPIFSLVMLSAFLLPLEAIWSSTPWVNIDYLEFILFSFPPMFMAIVIVAWIRHQGWLRPVNVPLISWEMILFQIARWPWVLWATVMAIATVVRNKNLEFRVTPKGVNNSSPIPLGIIAPYIFLGAIPAVFMLTITPAKAAHGYFYFALLNSLIYTILIFSVIYRHMAENDYSIHKT